MELKHTYTLLVLNGSYQLIVSIVELKQRAYKAYKNGVREINRIHCGIETILFLSKMILLCQINRIHCGIETLEKMKVLDSIGGINRIHCGIETLALR